MTTKASQALHSPEAFFSDYYQVFVRIAAHFIPFLSLLPGDKVLDVGCRNGKFTEVLAHLNPDIHFAALTTNEAFLKEIKADLLLQKLKNVQFEVADPKQLHFQASFDKVVSFLCLSWIEEKRAVLEGIFQSLKKGGKAYVQVFLQHDQPWFDTCIFEVAAKDKWKGYFKEFKKKSKHIQPAEFLALTEQVGFVLEKNYFGKKRIPILNKDYFKYWIMTMSSHLKYLPDDKIEPFFEEVVENYLITHPQDEQGRFYYEDYFFEYILLKP